VFKIERRCKKCGDYRPYWMFYKEASNICKECQIKDAMLRKAGKKAPPAVRFCKEHRQNIVGRQKKCPICSYLGRQKTIKNANEKKIGNKKLIQYYKDWRLSKLEKVPIVCSDCPSFVNFSPLDEGYFQCEMNWFPEESEAGRYNF